MVTHSLDLESSSSQYASIADGSCPNLEIGGAQTWECWIKPETLTSYQALMAKTPSSGSNARRFLLSADGGGAVYFDCPGLSVGQINSGSYNLVNGVWQHIAFVYTGSVIMLLFNGEIVAQSSATGSMTDANGDFAIGRNGANGAFYSDGLVRNARIWNVARTQAQIRADMNRDVPLVTTGLISNWILNNSYIDSVSGYNLTASGSPVFATIYPDAIDLVENNTWTEVHKITVDSDLVSGSSNLTDFPILLTESNFLSDILAEAQSAGQDLRFSLDEEGAERLAHEIVVWDDNSGLVAEVWVKINALDYDDDTTIYVHYGNATVSALNENEAYGKHQVWGGNWKSVWHLQESSGTRLDSTKNSYDLTDNNTVTNAAGKIQNAGNFVAANSEYLSIADGSCPQLEILGSQTWLAWVKPTTLTGTPFAKTNAGNTKYRKMEINGGGTIAFYISDLSTNTSITSSATISTGVNSMLGFVFDSVASKLKLWVNGVKNEVTASGSSGDTNAAFTIGRDSDRALNYMNGLIDNVMIYNGALSDDFITTLYNNQNNPGAFATPSALVDLPTVLTDTPANNIDSNSAQGGGEVIGDGGGTISERGIVWGASPNPTTAGNKQADGSGGTGSFGPLNMTGLFTDTTYYYRAYAINEAGTSYGDNVSFDTLDAVISGTVSSGGSPIEGAKVTLIDSVTDEVVNTTLSGFSGEYAFSGLDATHLYHVTCEFEDDGPVFYNTKSLPFVSPVEI